MAQLPPSYGDTKEEREEVESVRECFRVAYAYCIPHWVRAQRHADMYENIIDRNNWPTLSEIALPLFFLTVEQAMPFLVDYMFPDEGYLELDPVDNMIPYEAVRGVERYMEHQLRTQVRLKKHSISTLRDAMKYGCGYGVVEPKIIYPNTLMRRTAVSAGNPIATSDTITPGDAATVSSYRPIGFGNVLPIGDGPDIDSNSVVIWVDFYDEGKLRALWANDQTYKPEDRVFKRDVDAIIAEAKTSRLDASIMPPSSIIAKLGGKLVHEVTNQNMNYKRVPAVIPMVKCFYQNKHVWLANGTTVVYKQESLSKEIPLKRPLVQAKPWIDSEKFFNPGLAGIAEDLNYGVNVFYNAVMDLLQYYLNPPRVVNTRMIRGKSIPKHEPYATYKVSGDPQKVVHYPEPPPFPPGVLSFGDTLQEFYYAATGQPRALQGQASPGLVRGGLAAFETLLQTPMGREKFAANMLEMGWMEDTIDRVVIMEQMLASNSGVRFVDRAQDTEGNPYFNETQLTQDTLRHVFALRLNLRSKMRNAMSEHSLRAMRYDRLVQNPRIDQEALIDDLVGYRPLADRLKATPEQYRQNVAAMQQQQAASASPGEQALQGQGTSAGGVSA